jgi:hypothetical protein
MNTIKVLGSPLYQWEIGRKIQIIPVGGLRISVVHFSAVGDVNALVVEPKTENGRIIVDIPNILLQTGRNIVVYVVDVSEAGIETLRDCVLAVRGRAKPADYVYTETEVRTWGQLAERIAQLEENPASGGGTKESIVLTDQTTGAYYRLSVADGKLTMEVTTEQSNTAGIHLTDTKTGAKYIVYVSDGLLTMESEV